MNLRTIEISVHLNMFWFDPTTVGPVGTELGIVKELDSTEKMFALLEAFALSTTNMPVLRTASFRATDFQFHGYAFFLVEAMSAGESYVYHISQELDDAETRERARIYITTEGIVRRVLLASLDFVLIGRWIN